MHKLSDLTLSKTDVGIGLKGLSLREACVTFKCVHHLADEKWKCLSQRDGINQIKRMEALDDRPLSITWGSWQLNKHLKMKIQQMLS